MQNPVELHSRPNVSTLQSNVFISDELKSQRGFLYTRDECRHLQRKVKILLNEDYGGYLPQEYVDLVGKWRHPPSTEDRCHVGTSYHP